MPQPRRSMVAGAVTAAVVVVAVGVWKGSALLGPGGASPDPAARAFAASWQRGDLSGIPWDSPEPARAGVAFKAVAAGMATTGRDHPVVVQPGRSSRSGDRASVPLKVTWQINESAQWTYTSRLHLHLVGGVWRVAPDPTTVAPALTGGQVLSARRTTPPRADIYGADGSAVVTDRPVVDVGIEPARTKDPAATVSRTVAILNTAHISIDGAALLKRVAAARPHQLVAVVTLREPVYQQIKAQLQPLPGTVFTTGTLPLTPSPRFARALLGSAGPATAEAVARSHGSIRPGDIVGLSGLQAQFQRQLAGQDGVVVTASAPTAADRASAGAASSPSPSGAARPAQVLFQVAPKPGTPVHLTIDAAVQQAADAALSSATKPSALVAVRVSTGALLAVANGGPAGSANYDRALLGRYPPGSTFKIATTLALLRQGVTATDPVPCPPSVTVSGKTFTNAEHEQLGTVPFSTDFAQSCNTAFVGSAGKVSAAQLRQAATDVGYRSFSLGTPSADSQAPRTTDPVGHAAAMIGQGEVLATPLTVAVSAASVAAGRSVTPYLLTDDQPPAAAATLDAADVSVLRQLMRRVVTSGTGTALAAVPGGPVYGKTGTAEYGNATPPRTHAWFAGFQGDVAFAVLIEDGGFGAKAAAPVAASFLTRLAHG